MAQWKRAGPITQRSEDQNLALLKFFLLHMRMSEHVLLLIFTYCASIKLKKNHAINWRQRRFPFRIQEMPFLTVDTIIGNQAFQNGRCHICFSFGLDRVLHIICCWSKTHSPNALMFIFTLVCLRLAFI